jgi:Tol biopolymer transport system component
MQLTGEAVALTEGVAVRTGGGAVDLSLSATGTLWYAAGAVGSAGSFEAVSVGRDGSAVRVVDGPTGLIGDPALSPDGRRLALTTRELVSEILIKELDQGGALSKLTTDGNNNVRPAWSPDGRSVAFVSGSSVKRAAREQLADGSRPPTPLLDDRRSVEEVTFSHDGAWLVYRTGVSRDERDIFARRLGTDSSITLAATGADETSPALSPDGRWLAYVSDESGATEVYVRPFPNTADGRWQISAHGGQEPVWAHSGRELFYRTAGTASDSQMVMQVTTGHSFVPGARRALFPLTRYIASTTHQQYTVTPDDRRFVMIRSTEADRTDQLIVVENFFEVLRSRVGRR